MERTNGTKEHVMAGEPAAETPTTEASGAAAIAILRERPRNVHLFGGYGPLLAGAILLVLMLWLAPSTAPEHIVEQPVATTETTAP